MVKTQTYKMRYKHVMMAGGDVTASWRCIDCGVDTAPGCTNAHDVLMVVVKVMQSKRGLHAHTVVGQMVAGPKTELYTLRNLVWKKTRVGPSGGCLCVGCIEKPKRLGRRLTPEDFLPGGGFNDLPGSPRLLNRRGK